MALQKDVSIDDLNKLLSQAKGLHTRFQPTWYLNMAYFMGEQWIFWNRGRIDRPALPPWRVTLVDNRIIGMVEKEIARMTKQKPAWTVIPTTATDEDLQASETGERVLDYLWRDLHMEDRLLEALLWSRVCCMGFWKIYWDSAKGKQVTIVTDSSDQPVLDSATGAPMKPEHFEGQVPEGLKTKMIATGNACVEVLSPFEVFPDPIAHELHDCEWLIQVSVKSPEWVKQHYGEEVEPDTDIAPGPAESRLFPSFQLGGTSGYKGVMVKEYWCKPNSQHAEGRQAVWAKDKILYEGPNPYTDLPYVGFKSMPVPGRFWPTSLVEQLRGPQTEHNKIRSQITENAQRLGNPAFMASRQAKIEYQGTPGERIDYDDTTQNALPSYLQAPTLPPYVEKQQDRCEQSMEAIAAQHEVSNAQVPPGVKAASAINLLQEADDTRLGPAIRDMEKSLGEAGSKILKLVAMYWTEERACMVAGEDRKWNIMKLRGDALKENTHVEVQAGSAFPRSKAAKQAAMQDIMGLLMQYEGVPIGPRQWRKFLQDFDSGGLEKLFADLTVDEAQINRENDKLAQGIPIGINPYDNHELHIEGHTEWQKSPEYESAPEQVGAMTEQHIIEHRQQLAAVLQPPEQPQIQPGGQNGNQAQGSPVGATQGA